MSTAVSDRPAGFDSASKALAELRESPLELQKFVGGMFDELDVFAHKQLGREFASQQSQVRAEREAIQNQLDHLTMLMSELTKTVTDQKRLASQK
jgi:hypothetical protein